MWKENTHYIYHYNIHGVSPQKRFVWTHVFHGSDTAKTSTATLICLQDEAQTMRQRVAAPQVDKGPKGVPKQQVSTVKNPLQYFTVFKKKK